MENSDDGVIEEVESSNGSRKENSSCAKKKVWDLRMNVKLEVWGLRSGMKNRGYK